MLTPAPVPGGKKSSDMSGQQLINMCRSVVSGVSNRYEVKTSYEEVQMNTFSGKGGFGLVAAFTVLLMPLLGAGAAFAMGVGDTVTLKVPDLQQFLNSTGLEERVFTCRAVTEHAVWLVQDSSWVGYFGSNKVTLEPDSSRREEPKIVWGTGDTLNMVNPAELTALTQVFENEVWGKVTGFCGVPSDVDSDGKVYIVLASIPTQWTPSPDSRAVRGNMCYADPEFYEVGGNAAEVFFLNIHPYSTNTAWVTKREQLRRWNLADGLASLCMLSNEHDEDIWLVDAVAGAMQYECFGLTSVKFRIVKRGIAYMLYSLGKEPYHPLFNAAACSAAQDFQAARGQGFMWIMYLRQLYGDAVVTAMIKDTENAGVLSVAKMIDSSATKDNAVEVITPVYNDFQLACLCSGFHSDMNGGRYQFSFLVGSAKEDWSIANTSGRGGFTVKVESASAYPFGDIVAQTGQGMEDRVLCTQFVSLAHFDEATSDTVYLNCQYTDGAGSNSAVLSHWSAWSVRTDKTSGELLSLEPVVFGANYRAVLVGGGTDYFIVLTNADKETAPDLRYYVSQNTEIASVESAVHANPFATGHLTFYTTLFSAAQNDYALFDWYGPVFTATQGDSVQNIKMKTFATDLYTAQFSAWEAGSYKLEVTGFTAAGFVVQSLVSLSSGYADNDLVLEIPEATLSVPRGGASAGSMVMLYDCGALDFSMQNNLSMVEARGRMTGIVAGPVHITDADGVLSFESTTNTPVVYRYTAGEWNQLPSFRQNGRTSAMVDEAGIYALGEGIGTYSPELPNQLLLNDNAPNPFAAQTAINFSLPASGNVVVKVFDMTGRLVATVANEDMAAANHTIIWDGTDSSGIQVGAGVYFCRLEAAGQVLTQKMLKVQ